MDYLKKVENDGKILLDAGDTFESHVLGDFYCIRTPGSNHFTAWTDETNVFTTNRQPEPIIYIEDLEDYNEKEGLALSKEEMDYLTFESHVLGDFYCIRTPGSNHFTAWTDETAFQVFLFSRKG